MHHPHLIRHAPGAIGSRHLERTQDETFLPIRGTLTLYLGDPAERHEIPVGTIVHIEAGAAQMVNEGDEELAERQQRAFVLEQEALHRQPAAEAGQ